MEDQINDLPFTVKIELFRQAAIGAGHKASDVNKIVERIATEEAVRQGFIPFTPDLATKDPFLALKLGQEGFTPSDSAKTSDAEKKAELGKANANRVISQLEDLYFGFDTGDGPLAGGRVGGFASQISARAGTNPRLRVFENTRKAARPTLARAAGDVGNLTEQEQGAAISQIPSGTSTMEEALLGFQEARKRFGLPERDLSTELKSGRRARTPQLGTTGQTGSIGDAPQFTDQFGKPILSPEDRISAINATSEPIENPTRQSAGPTAQGDGLLGLLKNVGSKVVEPQTKFISQRGQQLQQASTPERVGQAALTSVNPLLGLLRSPQGDFDKQGLEAAGQVASFVPVLGPGTLPARLGAAGAISGFTDADAEDLMDRFKNAAIQGATGAVVGATLAALGGLLRTGSKVSEGVRDKVTKTILKMNKSQVRLDREGNSLYVKGFEKLFKDGKLQPGDYNQMLTQIQNPQGGLLKANEQIINNAIVAKGTPTFVQTKSLTTGAEALARQAQAAGNPSKANIIRKTVEEFLRSNPDKLSSAQLLSTKRLLDNQLSDAMFKQVALTPSASAKASATRAIGQSARTTLKNQLPAVKDALDEQAILMGIKDALTQQLQRSGTGAAGLPETFGQAQQQLIGRGVFAPQNISRTLNPLANPLLELLNRGTGAVGNAVGSRAGAVGGAGLLQTLFR